MGSMDQPEESTLVDVLRAERDAVIELLPDPQEEDFDVAAVGRIIAAVEAAQGAGYTPDAVEELLNAATDLGDRYSARITDLTRRNSQNGSRVA